MKELPAGDVAQPFCRRGELIRLLVKLETLLEGDDVALNRSIQTRLAGPWIVATGYA